MNDHITVLLIDDDELNNYVNRKLIEKAIPNPVVTSFINGKEAIEFLLEQKRTGRPLPDVIFLDITMPRMGGWEFLDEFIRLQIDTAGQCLIYMLSVSVFTGDIRRAGTYPIVKNFISKPLNIEKIHTLLLTEKAIRRQQSGAVELKNFKPVHEACSLQE